MMKIRVPFKTVYVLAAVQFFVLGHSNQAKSYIEQKPDSSTVLLPFMSGVNGKYGFTDRTGKIVIRPMFDKVGRFSEGLAPASINGKFGYIDEFGNFVIKPQFPLAEEFSEGLARVQSADKPSYRDKKLRVIAYGYIDRSGKMVIPAQYSSDHEPRKFSEGLVVVKVKDRYGYMDRTGRIAIEPVYLTAARFSEGLAHVMTSDETHNYIDKSGSPVKITDKSGSPVEMEDATDARDFSEGLAAVRIYGRWGYIDKSGRFVIERKFDEASDFSEGLACVRIRVERNDSWGYIDKKGTLVIAPRYRSAGNFSEGLALVNEDVSGYIDKTGKMVIKNNFIKENEIAFGHLFDTADEVEGFSGGVAVVRTRQPLGFLDDNSFETYIHLNTKGETVFFWTRRLRRIEAGNVGFGQMVDLGLVEVNICSQPAGAAIYFVPADDLDFDKNILNNAKQLAEKYRLPDGDTTPCPSIMTPPPRVKEQKYTVVFELNGKRETRPLDANPKSSNKVQVTFQ